MTPQQDCYRCSKYKSNTGDCTMHFIREEMLKRFVRQRIFDVTAMFFDDIGAFRSEIQRQQSAETEKAVKRRKKELEQARTRIVELDRIFKRIYEDDISGAISQERFLKLSGEYEADQKELTPTIVNEFVKKIIVHAPDKSSGHRRQKLEIVWTFIGKLEQDEDAQTLERQRKSKTA